MKTKSTLFCLVFAFCVNINTANAQVNVQDSLALVDFYNSTDGPHWKNNSNWLTSSPVSSWYGIYVKNKRVFDIILNDNRLKGTIPASIGNLNHLVQFYIYNNQIIGNIPSSIGNTNLFTFIASNNRLCGSIPASIGKLVDLTDLVLDNNQLSGSLPSSLANIGLMYVDLHNNQLTGSIPSLGKTGYLLHLDLSHNQLSGSIPSSLGKFSSYLNLSHNQLTGNIPSAFYNGTYIAYLYLNNNQ